MLQLLLAASFCMNAEHKLAVANVCGGSSSSSIQRSVDECLQTTRQQQFGSGP